MNGGAINAEEDPVRHRRPRGVLRVAIEAHLRGRKGSALRSQNRSDLKEPIRIHTLRIRSLSTNSSPNINKPCKEEEGKEEVRWGNHLVFRLGFELLEDGVPISEALRSHGDRFFDLPRWNLPHSRRLAGRYEERRRR
ncbi:hypothetical protein B296_00003410, partial [Ensete ventricosum]